MRKNQLEKTQGEKINVPAEVKIAKATVSNNCKQYAEAIKCGENPGDSCKVGFSEV